MISLEKSRLFSNSWQGRISPNSPVLAERLCRMPDLGPVSIAWTAGPLISENAELLFDLNGAHRHMQIGSSRRVPA